MTRHIVYRLIAGLLLLAAIAGIGYFAFQAGTAHGAGLDLTAVPSDSLPYRAYGWHFMPFFGPACLAPLAVLFLACLAFGMLRRAIWGPRWGWRHMHGPWDEKWSGRRGPWGEGVPPFFAEWHRRAHAGEVDSPGQETKDEGK